MATNIKITLNDTTFTTILAANAARKYVRIYNNNAHNANIVFGAAGSAVVDTGTCICGDGCWETNIIDVPYTGEISGISTRGNLDLLVIEV